MSSVDVTTMTRSAAAALVDREVRRSGSRTVAYEIVAQTIGTSSSWLKKFILNSSEVKEPRITLFLNIRDNYNNLCNRVEQENRNDEAIKALLRERINAVAESLGTQGNPQNTNRVAQVDEPR